MTGRFTEAHFQQQVEQLAGFYGWATYHTHDSRRSTPGFPDLVLVRDAELIFAELKTDTGRVRPEQTVWLAALTVVADASKIAAQAGLGTGLAVDVFLWRPADFDAILHRLAAGRHIVRPDYVTEATS